MNLINEGIQATHPDDSGQYRQSQTTQTGFFQTEPDISESISLIGTSKLDFKEAISRVDPSVLANVSQSLQLPSPSAIFEFADNLNDNQFQFLLRLLSPIEQAPYVFNVPSALTPEQIEFFDLGFRFVVNDFQSSILAGPFFIGSQPQHFSESIIAPNAPNQKIIFQSISMAGVSFPPSLTMWYGESLLHSPNFTTSRHYIDLSPLINGKSNKLLEFFVQKEPQWYCIVIRAVKKLSYSDLISTALQKRLPPSTQTSVCCPMTGKVMKVPARSIRCQHSQCFELKNAIRRNEPGTPLKCPICREEIEFDDIAVDWEMMGSITGQRIGSALNCL